MLTPYGKYAILKIPTDSSNGYTTIHYIYIQRHWNEWNEIIEITFDWIIDECSKIVLFTLLMLAEVSYLKDLLFVYIYVMLYLYILRSPKVIKWLVLFRKMEKKTVDGIQTIRRKSRSITLIYFTNNVLKRKKTEQKEWRNTEY